MKITRNGIEYELTAQELLAAYREQQHLNDISNVKLNLKYNLSEEQMQNVENNDDFLNTVVCYLRSNLDDLGMDFDVAVSKAIEESYDEFDFFDEEDLCE